MKTEIELAQGEERKSYVKRMFNAIARRYDLLNHLLQQEEYLFIFHIGILLTDLPEFFKTLLAEVLFSNLFFHLVLFGYNLSKSCPAPAAPTVIL
jgi:hypothetical protein